MASYVKMYKFMKMTMYEVFILLSSLMYETKWQNVYKNSDVIHEHTNT